MNKNISCLIHWFIYRSLGVLEQVLNTNVILLKPKFQEIEKGKVMTNFVHI